MATDLNIHKAARAAGVSPSALRLWEGRGLVSPRKTPHGHRRYRQEDLSRIRDIVRLRSLQGLNLAAIGAILGANGTRPTRGGEGPGTHELASLTKLARCYGTTVSALSADGRQRGGKVIRAGKYRRLPILGDGIKIEQLAEGRCAMECQRFTLSPGAGSQGQYSHEGEEFIHVLSGRFDITLDGRERYRLGQGDSMYFKSSVLHAWMNPGPGTAVLLWINTPPTF